MRKDENEDRNGRLERRRSSRELLRSLVAELMPGWLKRDRVKPGTTAGPQAGAKRFRSKR